MTYSESRERLNQAKAIPLVGLIKELGYELQDTGSYLRMLSPFRSEGNSSFDIDKRKPWKWIDRGSGKKGDVIDFVQQLYKMKTSSAIDFLICRANIPLPVYEPVIRDRNSIEITHIEAYLRGICPELDDYIASRYICPQIAQKWLKIAQIKFPYSKVNPEKIHTVLAFENDSHGYEFRSKRFKIGNSPKNVTTIKKNHTVDVDLFEGFPDFLTNLTIMEQEEPDNTTIILNSVSFLNAMLPFLDNRIVSYFGHNDKAGEDGKAKLKESGIIFTDKRNHYKGYKDINDWWVAQHKKKGFLSDILKF